MSLLSCLPFIGSKIYIIQFFDNVGLSVLHSLVSLTFSYIYIYIVGANSSSNYHAHARRCILSVCIDRAMSVIAWSMSVIAWSMSMLHSLICV